MELIRFLCYNEPKLKEVFEMAKTGLQFYATTGDIHEFILEICENNNYKICGVILFPNYTVKNVDIKSIKEGVESIKGYDFIVISKNDIKIADNNFKFMQFQDNNLVIEIGKNNDKEIIESLISVVSEIEIDSDWKKAINKYRKNLLKGAWVVNPQNNTRVFYKDMKYTANAKNAYENGVRISPFFGCINFCELVNEDEKY